MTYRASGVQPASSSQSAVVGAMLVREVSGHGFLVVRVGDCRPAAHLAERGVGVVQGKRVDHAAVVETLRSKGLVARGRLAEPAPDWFTLARGMASQVGGS